MIELVDDNIVLLSIDDTEALNLRVNEKCRSQFG